MTKIIFAGFLGLLLFTSGAIAQETDSACGQQTVAVLYFNGVATGGAATKVFGWSTLRAQGVP